MNSKLNNFKAKKALVVKIRSYFLNSDYHVLVMPFFQEAQSKWTYSKLLWRLNIYWVATICWLPLKVWFFLQLSGLHHQGRKHSGRSPASLLGRQSTGNQGNRISHPCACWSTFARTALSWLGRELKDSCSADIWESNNLICFIDAFSSCALTHSNSKIEKHFFDWTAYTRVFVPIIERGPPEADKAPSLDGNPFFAPQQVPLTRSAWIRPYVPNSYHFLQTL